MTEPWIYIHLGRSCFQIALINDFEQLGEEGRRRDLGYERGARVTKGCAVQLQGGGQGEGLDKCEPAGGRPCSVTLFCHTTSYLCSTLASRQLIAE